MKHIILFSVLFSGSVWAQMPSGFNSANMAQMEKSMQNMMQGMMQMEDCMSKIDQSQIDTLGEKASRLEQEIAQLCEQGQRSAALDKAIGFSKEMKNNSEMQKMQKCLAPMGGLMQSAPFATMYNDFADGKKHICD